MPLTAFFATFSTQMAQLLTVRFDLFDYRVQLRFYGFGLSCKLLELCTQRFCLLL